MVEVWNCAEISCTEAGGLSLARAGARVELLVEAWSSRNRV